MGYLLFFFVSALVFPDPAQLQPCSSESPSLVLRFEDVGANQRILAHHRAPGAMDPLYSLVQSYLDVIQQNPFPTGLLRDALNDPPSASTSQILQYQTGYIICATIAVIYFVSIPVTGLSICCCRRRRRCGGRIKAYRRSLLCKRNFLMLCLLLTTLLKLAGVICAFAANQKVKEEMEPGTRDALNTLQAVRHHVNGIPQGVQRAVDQFAVPKEQIFHDLNDVGWSIGSTIQLVLKGTVYSAMAAMKSRVQDLQNSLHHLQTLNTTVQALIRSQSELEPALKDRKRSITSLLHHPQCAYCLSVLSRAESLELGANYRKVPSVEGVLKTLHGLPKANFTEMIHRANRTFNSIPELARAKMAEVVSDLKAEIEKAARKVQSIADGFPILDHTRPMNDALIKAENSSRPYLKEVKHYERYRWIVGVIACTVILLIVFCNLLGLSLGAYGLAVREDPSDYESRGEAGAKLLLTGVGFSFLFSWLLILLVFGTFLVGGNVQTLLCKHWANKEIYKVCKMLPQMECVGAFLKVCIILLSHAVGEELGQSQPENSFWVGALQESDSPQCKNGAGFWEVLHLEDRYNLNEHLSIAKYTAEFQKRLSHFHTRFEDIVLLNAEGRKDLETFRDSRIDQIDFAAFAAESDRTLAERLVDEAKKLKKIQNMTVLMMEALVDLINSTESQIGQAETIIPLESQKILRQELNCFERKEVGYISQYLNWLRSVLTEDVASCQPFSTALDNGRVILCDRITDAWNAFWFSLGGCTFFLIPSIFFAIKITKHFRPIRHRLVSTGSEETYPFHIPRVTSLRL
ncbi:hypothetical protein JD844_030968 [Phrynosoma platyrhinos]|uniref:Prominin 2 n=1 Tax=Phrynosoma platyrhinos TaxID=52577 RepID=A0ABQ7T0V3_PHRPL|nr:hypothetical protein JD844_030968 [Phrynosoma platyrhinos]